MILFLLAMLLVMIMALVYSTKNSIVLLILIYLPLLYLVIMSNYQHTREGYSVQVKGKTVWLLWLQGWGDAPWLVQQVRRSWEHWNPTWNIVTLDAENLRDYLPAAPTLLANVPGSQAQSDVIRLNLLATHGGVWADATMLCMASLEAWVYEALQPAGFWMYHGRDYGMGPASWFIISQRQSYLIHKWCDACNEFWLRSRPDVDYFWMDALFNDLYNNDHQFKTEWHQVPYIWAESPFQAHMLAGLVTSWNPELHEVLQTTPPYAIKLSHHDFPADMSEIKKTNAYIAINSSLNRNETFIHPMHHIVRPKVFTKDTVLVSPDCADKAGIEFLEQITNEHNIQLIVYDKCNFCAHVPFGVYCRPLPNVGRDMGTFVYFVLTHYDDLPNEILFIPSNIKKHHRKERLEDLLADPNTNGCDAAPMQNQGEFTLSQYEDNDLTHAFVRPLQAWYNKYVNNYEKDKDKSGPCWNGIMRTYRSNILKHPKHLYVNIYEHLKVADSAEVVHYVERIMQLIF